MFEKKLKKYNIIIIDKDDLFKNLLFTKLTNKLPYNVYMFSKLDEFNTFIENVRQIHKDVNILIIDGTKISESSKLHQFNTEINQLNNKLKNYHVLLLTEDEKKNNFSQLKNIASTIKKNENAAIIIENQINFIISKDKLSASKKIFFKLLYITIGLLIIILSIFILNYVIY